MTPPSLSINRVELLGKNCLSSSLKNLAFKLFALVGCHVVLLLLRPVEKRKGENGDGENVCRGLTA